MQSFTPKFRGTDYLEQWDRVQRWYLKVKDVETNACQKGGIGISELEDYLYFFFLNILNLKDWLKNSVKERINAYRLADDCFISIKKYMESKGDL